MRISLNYSDLNDVDGASADIQNSYLQAPSSDNHFIVCGPEFGLEHMGKIALIC